ncbi:MAG: hypothetical protein F4X23_13605 [Gemmatimonadales bacterium]|nr:hypothetical protein [Gemmatimonadales bacterium]
MVNDLGFFFVVLVVWWIVLERPPAKVVVKRLGFAALMVASFWGSLWFVSVPRHPWAMWIVWPIWALMAATAAYISVRVVQVVGGGFLLGLRDWQREKRHSGH